MEVEVVYITYKNLIETNKGLGLLKSWPIQQLLKSTMFENIILAGLVTKTYPKQRIQAILSSLKSSSLEEFIRLLCISDLSKQEEKRTIKGLAKFEGIRLKWQNVNAEWEQAFWSTNSPNTEPLVELESRRRDISDKYYSGSNSFAFLLKNHKIRPIEYITPLPDDVKGRWDQWMNDPVTAYAPPVNMPMVEISQSVTGPMGLEYWIRFKSPSPFFSDYVLARVYEPEGCNKKNTHTLIAFGGLGELLDCTNMNGGEALYARDFNKLGCRVITPHLPWHGRRTPQGWFSGEPYLAAAPEGLAQLYTAAAKEASVIINWVRGVSEGKIAVGGISLGGIVSQAIIGYCNTWPEHLRPDAGFLNTSCDRIEKVVLGSKLTEVLGLSDELKRKGWDEEYLIKFAAVLNPPEQPALPPESIFAVLGKRDEMMPYSIGTEMLKRWKVPQSNITLLNTGHLGVAFSLYKNLPVKKQLVDYLNLLSV